MRNHFSAFLRAAPAVVTPAAFMPVLLMLVLAGGASAQVVTNGDDSGPGTLRSAIATATNHADITFATNLSGATITLDSTLSINTNLTIDASALPGGIQIIGDGLASNSQNFNVSSGVTNVFNSLTIADGFTGGNGGGIVNEGTLTLNQCTVSENYAEGAGGGIVNGGTLTLNQCTVSGNYAGTIGSGIDNSGTLTLNQCTVSKNYAESAGGGIDNNGPLTLNGCTVSGNSTPQDGGGIDNDGPLTITNTIVAGNSSLDYGPPNIGGDIYNYTNTTLAYGGSNLVQFVFNDGGVITGRSPLSAAPDLAGLGNYGGPTQTMPPLPGSPAIGAGSVPANTFTNDQRGYARKQNGLIDLGAVELPTVPRWIAIPMINWQPTPVQFTSTNVDSDGSGIIQWNWSFGDGNTSTSQNPSNAYATTGNFLPGLTVVNTLGLTLGVSGPAIIVYPPLTLTGISASGTNLMISGTEGVYGLAYTVLTSTNLALPLSQWTALPPNYWTADGNFTLTVTNGLNRSVPKRFYMLKVP